MVLGSQRHMAGAEVYGAVTSVSAPVGNAIGREPSVPVIFPDPTAPYLEFGLSSAIAVNILAILYCNGSTACTRRWRGATTREGLTDGSAGYDSTAEAGWFADDGLKSRKFRKHDVLWLGGSPQTFQWWRVDFADPGNTAPEGFIVGKIVIDAAWQPAINMAYGGGGGLVDHSRKPRSQPGQVQPLRRDRHRLHRFTLAFQSEEQLLGYADDLDEAVGTTDPVLFMREAEPTTFRQKKVIYGLQNDVGQMIDSAFEIYEKTYEIEELAA